MSGVERFLQKLNAEYNQTIQESIRVDWDTTFNMLNFAQQSLVQNANEETLLYGGNGVGKTTIMGFLSAYFVHKYPKSLGLLAANTGGQLNKSTLKGVKTFWRDMLGWKEYSASNPEGVYVYGRKPPPHFKNYHLYDDYKGIVSFVNGGCFVIGSLINNAHKHLDGIEVSWILLDETKDTKPEAISGTLLGRLRHKEAVSLSCFGNTKKMLPIFIFTVPSEDCNWINKMFGLENHKQSIVGKIYLQNEYSFFQHSTEKQNVVIASSYTNEKNLPDGYIERIKRQDNADFKVYSNPFGRSGELFYSNFSSNNIITKNDPPDPEYDIWLSLDFNVRPYISLLVGQKRLVKDSEYSICHVINEFTPSGHDANAQTIANWIISNYSDYKENSRFYITGDASGKSENVNQKRFIKIDDFKEERATMYHDIFDILRSAGFDARFMLPSVEKNGRGGNPYIKLSANFLNGTFKSKTLPNGKIVYIGSNDVFTCINAQCQKTIGDAKTLKVDTSGGIKVTMAKNNAGQVYETNGHLFDALRYFLCMAFAPEYKQYAISQQQFNYENVISIYTETA